MLRLPAVLLALAAFFTGLAVLVASALGALTRARRPGARMRATLAPYGVTRGPGGGGAGRDGAPDDGPDDGHRGPGPRARGVWGGRDSTDGLLGRSAVGRSALDLAERVVVRRGLEEVLGARLEASGLPLRTAEWLLLHVGCAVGGGLLLLLLSAGALPATVLGLVLGVAGPWLFLSLRRGRREKAFLAQLPDTLQLLAGGLRAGYSLPQAVDTVVRQADPPMSSELHRALVEGRLGVPMEDALEHIGERLNSYDFSWVVMAIRIQREVGGNLAELLVTVADTLRERERLRRQVEVLSAEGRLSGIILGSLPVGFAAYLLVARPDYLAPLLTPLGLVLLVVAVVLLAVGSLWVSRVVKVEV